MKLSDALKVVEHQGKTVIWYYGNNVVHKIKKDENGDVLIKTIGNDSDPDEQTILPMEGWE